MRNISKKNSITILLTLSMFFTGASGLVNEYVLSTISTYILGSSIEQFSITIALMLGMMGFGSWFQKKIKNNNLIEKFIVIEILLAVIGSYSPIFIYMSYGYFENNFNLIYYFIVILIGFLIGLEIPFIIRINEKYNPVLKENLSFIIPADYIGSFIGAIIWVYFLLPNFRLTQISFLISGLNFFIAIITYFYFLYLKEIKLNVLKLIILILTPLLLIISFGYIPKMENLTEQKFYEDPIISSTTTKYQHLVLTHNKTLNEYRLYINGNVQFSTLDEKRYHEILVHPVMSLNINTKKDILILGGGDGLALRELKKYNDINSITLVDLDPLMVKFASNNNIMKKINNNSFDNCKLTILNNKSISAGTLKDVIMINNNTKENTAVVNVINVDADKFLSQIENKKFDIIIIDFPDPSTVELTKLYTKEFFLKLKKVMKNSSIGIIQSTSPFHAKEAFLCIGRTIKSSKLNAIPLHFNIPSFGDWGWYIFSKLSYKELYSRINNLKKFNVETSYLTPELFKTTFIFGKGELITNDKRINTLMFPVLFDIYIHNSWLNY